MHIISRLRWVCHNDWYANLYSETKFDHVPFQNISELLYRGDQELTIRGLFGLGSFNAMVSDKKFGVALLQFVPAKIQFGSFKEMM